MANDSHLDPVIQAGVIEVGGGRFLAPLSPRPSDINITDIGQSLGNQCRFTGFTRRFYSVAEHSVIMSHLVDPENAKAALVHDAPEYVTKDHARPMKKAIPQLADIEKPMWAAMCELWGMPEELPAQVVEYDMRICSNEKMAFLSPNWEEQEHWADYIRKHPPLPGCRFLDYCPPDVAGHLWVLRFNELFGTDYDAPHTGPLDLGHQSEAWRLLGVD